MSNFTPAFVNILNNVSSGHELIVTKWSKFDFGGLYEKPDSSLYIPEKNYVENLRKAIVCEAVDEYFNSIDDWYKYDFKDFCKNVYESDLI